WELSRVWKDVDEDPETRVVIVTGKGRAFSAGGDLEMIEKMKGSAANIGQAWREAGDIVYNMLNLDKPIISAINGVAVGAGLAVALMADVSIAAENIRFAAGRRRWRSCCDSVAAGLRHGQSEVLLAHRRLHRWQRGGAHRLGQLVRAS